MGIGERIAETRKRKNLTQEQLASLISVSRQAVSRWESELAYPETERIVVLSELLNVSCDYLLRGGEQEEDVIAYKNPITKLLNDTIGKHIKITFYNDALDYELSGKICTISSFDGNWANVEYNTKKELRAKLVPVSSILSITYTGEEE